MILYFHFLQKDLKIVYLFQQQRFSSSTMLIEHSLKESPRMYCQGRMQPHAFFPHCGLLNKAFGECFHGKFLKLKHVNKCLKPYELPMYENK